MKIKVVLSALLSITLLAACGDNNDPEENGNSGNTQNNVETNEGDNNNNAVDESGNNEGGTDEAGEADNGTNEETDAVTTASIVSEPDAFVNAVSENGTWIIATLNDLTIDEEIVVAGQFHDKGDEENAIYRKIAAYTQDDDRNILDSFTITVPSMTVQSENLNFQGGTLAGDVYVEANGFNLDTSSTIDGNLYFASEEFQDSAVIEGEVTGDTEVQ